jgi:hypothetical protein
MRVILISCSNTNSVTVADVVVILTAAVVTGAVTVPVRCPSDVNCAGAMSK